jgi:hypothetical protein
VRSISIKGAVVLTALFFFAACGAGSAGGPARVVLNTDAERPTIDVVDVPADQLQALQGTESRDAWAAVLKISVGNDQPAMLGDYRIENGRVRFTPMFPLDPGREYHVAFTLPGATALTSIVALAANDATPKTTVAEVYPTSEMVPENQLRLYVHFSAPMGMKGGLDFIHLLDDGGKEVKDPFLPLDAEFFNDDRTRYTVFFDPGRQKRGIPVIEGMGRSLTEGRSYTLVIDSEWRDGNGLPMTRAFRRTFKVGPPDEKPLDPKAWTITPPAAGATNALRIMFPEPLDHGLLLRMLGVLAPDGKPLPGDVHVGRGEAAWQFTPREAWQAGAYNLLAFAALEDLAGNRIGRAFEVDQFDRADRSGEPEKTLIPFTIR